MKKVIFVGLILVLGILLASCEEPYEEGLFLKNSSDNMCGFYVAPYGVVGRYELVDSGNEWHYTSSWYGNHNVEVDYPVFDTVTEEWDIATKKTTVYVPKGGSKKAAVVEWNGTYLDTYER